MSSHNERPERSPSPSRFRFSIRLDIPVRDWSPIRDKHTVSPSKSPTRSLAQILLPFKPSNYGDKVVHQLDRHTIELGQPIQLGLQNTSSSEIPSYRRDVSLVKSIDFADTSSESSTKSQAEIDAESIEDIFKEYEDNNKSFIFKEEFDDKSRTDKSIENNESYNNMKKLEKSFDNSLERANNKSYESEKVLENNHTSSDRSELFYDALPSQSNRNSILSERNSNFLYNKHFSSSTAKKYFESTTFDSSANDTLERPLYNNYDHKNSTMSLTSGELLNKLENKSLNELSEKSYEDININDEDNKENVISHSPVILYRVGDNHPPKLIQISPTNLPPVHYHDSDISSNESISNDIPRVEHRGNVISEQRFGPPVRRPPPNIPIQDSLVKTNNHENMWEVYPSYSDDTPPSDILNHNQRPQMNVNYSSSNSTAKVHDSPTLIPTAYPNFKSSTTSLLPNYYSDEDIFMSEKFNPRPKVFSWQYFTIMMLVGLVIPPVYFLLSLGVFDKLESSKSYYSGIYYKNQYLVNHSKLVKFSPLQKSLSFIFGILWICIILAMIGLGFGLTQ